MAHVQTPIIGLVGGVGCGKSAIAGWLRDELGAKVVDADVIGHEVLQCKDIQQQLRDEFGDGIFSEGAVDRAAVAARVFGDSSENQMARETLEKIVHPAIRDKVRADFAAARLDPDVPLIVYDAAVQLESGWDSDVDRIAFIDVPFQERLRRVSMTRGWSEDELRRREASQWPLDKKRAAADVVIDNSSTVEAAGNQLLSYLQQYELFNTPTVSTTVDPITT